MVGSTDKYWQRARRYIDQNQAAPAKAALESLLSHDPDDAAAHMILGGLYAAEDHHRLAVEHALAAARNPPHDPGRLGDLIAALLKVGEIVTARRLLVLPTIADSDSAHVLMRAATQRQQTGEHALALGLLGKAAAAGAVGRDFHFYRAVQLAFNGNMAEAQSELERCIELDPPLGRAFVQLARMHTQTASSNHLASIESALARVEQGSEDHAALEFARYKELEDLKRHDDAWQALVRGNAMMRARLPHDSVHEAMVFDQLLEACQASPPKAGSMQPDDGPQPIFVIGMPRSGTTVLERMLGGHSQVESAGELGDFSRALGLATDHLATVMLDETTIERFGQVDWAEVGRVYLEQTRWRAHDKAFFVDKLPRNWMLAGLICRALPHAKILHLIRDPMDVCFSNWRAYFGPGPEFAYAYDLDTLAAHYQQYRQVMAHWHHLVPGAILDVDYTQLVRQPEAAVRRILAFCGLAWEPGCIDLSRNESPVATLSVSQVRQPIHAKSFEEWRPYARQLEGLHGGLGIAR